MVGWPIEEWEIVDSSPSILAEVLASIFSKASINIVFLSYMSWQSDLCHISVLYPFLLSKSLLYFFQVFEIQLLFHKLMDRYQACLYLFQCIFQAGFKYDQEIPKC